jgi:NTE family protein
MFRSLMILLFCCLPALSNAQDAPRTGLVLSGGAARGLAHIGVLKALEEQGVRIDAIAGTSMGAVIGGLYASGYTVAELEQLARTLDWRQVLSDDPPRPDVPFRRKQDDRDFLVKRKLSFRDDGSLGLPLGVIQGQNLALLLERLLVHVSDTRDFDRLPIAAAICPRRFAPACRFPPCSPRWKSRAACSSMAAWSTTSPWMSPGTWASIG